MRLIKGEDAREMDQKALKEYGLHTLVLMENAGLRSADFIEERFPITKGDVKISILLGKGNNAGDALVMARHLKNKGYQVSLFSVFPLGEYGDAAKANRKIVEAMGMEIKVLENERDLFLFKVTSISSHLIVDGIFGSGVEGNITGIPASAINIINELPRPVVSLDLPSGVNADTGEVSDPTVKATWTLTFALPKYGNVLGSGKDYNGEWKVLDISFPKELTEEKENDDILIDKHWVLKQMKPRAKESHKGLCGHVFVVGGAKGMEGSLLLAGEGALRSGAGLVTYVMPESLYPGVVAHNTAALTYSLPETAQGSLAAIGAEEVLKQTGNKVLVMGMGMSRNEDATTFVKTILTGYNCPMVMDADALMALGEMEERKASKWPLILTPHPGEMARLLQWNIKEVQENRTKAALLAAEKYNAIVVLKGHKTLIATPKGKLLVNLTGNPGMATGGMGDVLAGIIGAFLGQGLSPLAAAALGVYFHGLAGDSGAADKGEMGLCAEDIPLYLPGILAKYEAVLKEGDIHVL